jgi:DNA modification methylase
MTPDQEAKANDYAAGLLERLTAAETDDDIVAICKDTQKAVMRLQEIGSPRFHHIVNFVSLRRIDGAGIHNQKGVQMAIKKDVTIGDCRLILGDCLEVMPLLGKVDAVDGLAIITDPPYGIGIDGQTQRINGKKSDRKGYEFKGWDKDRPEDALRMIAKIECPKIVWGGNYFADLFPAGKKWLSWDKGQRINQSDCELAYTNLKGALRVFTLNRVALMQDGAQHPTQKPVALMQWCLGFLPDAETILDPFMGSGTTLVACAKLGRKGIGIELDQDYFEIACERVQKAYDQPDLFVAPPVAPTQEGMDI